jgi:branched-chain amino acid transport system substrate-binding protein
MRGSTRGRVALAVIAVGACALAATAAARTHAPAVKKPIVIGWAHDSTGPMAPFDGPALAAAQIEVKKINRKGGVLGSKLVIKTCDTQGDNAAVSKACADKLIGQGAKIIFTTCDVDLAAPVVQESLNKGLLTIAPCIGTDQMGPKRFGAKGKLAFSFGNVAQDEGSAMAQYAWGRGWRSASLATDGVIVYFKNIVQAFKARWLQLGGKIVDQETYQDPTFGGNNVQNAVSRLNNVKADVIVTSTAGAYGALAPLITGLRTLGNNTPVINSWAGDGVYWLPKTPKVTNYYFVTYADAFGGDPNPAVNALAKKIHAATGGFVTGPAAIDGLATAIREAGGSTNGAVLAAKMVAFHNVPTLSGLVSFSPQLHSVFHRQYRVIEINNNVPRLVAQVVAKVVPKIS